jgi:hypothetical protein
MTADTIEEGSTSALARAAVVFCRVVQVALVVLAVIFILGSLMAGMNVIAFAAIGVFALVLLGFAGVVEGVARLIRGRSG